MQGKTAVITGGNSGVGSANVLLFASEGADVVVINARRVATLEDVAAKITEADGKVLDVPAVIAKKENCENTIFKTINKSEALGLNCMCPAFLILN